MKKELTWIQEQFSVAESLLVELRHPSICFYLDGQLKGFSIQTFC